MLLVGVGVVRERLGDGLAVGHLGAANGRFDLELTHHAVDENFEVKLAHAADDGLAGFNVGFNPERGVFSRQRGQSVAQLVLVCFRVWLDRQRRPPVQGRSGFQERFVLFRR